MIHRPDRHHRAQGRRPSSRLRNDVAGDAAVGMVLTLVIVTDDTEATTPSRAANDAAGSTPAASSSSIGRHRRGTNRLDAEVRVVGDAGPGEIVVLRLHGELADHAESVVLPLLLPDAPVVAWWPGESPADLRKDPVGRLAQRRITDSAAAPSPQAALKRCADGYQPGDTDLAWTRITLVAHPAGGRPRRPPYSLGHRGGRHRRRGLAVVRPAGRLAGAVPQVPSPGPAPRRAPGSSACASSAPTGRSTSSVRTADRHADPARAARPRGGLKRRGLAEIIAEELRRLDADEVYAETLLHGLPALTPATRTATEAAEAGLAPSIADSRRISRRIARDSSAEMASAMVTADPAPATGDTAQVRKATAHKLADKPTPREKQVARTSSPATTAGATKAPAKKRATSGTEKASS